MSAKRKEVELMRDLPQQMTLLFDPGSMQDLPNGSRRRIRASRHVGHPGERMTLCLQDPEKFTKLDTPLTLEALVSVTDCGICKRVVRDMLRATREQLWDCVDIIYDSYDGHGVSNTPCNEGGK